MNWYISFKKQVRGTLKTKLICFPHAGASPAFFAPLAKSYGAIGCEIISVFLPGRASRYKEESISEWSPLVAKVYENIKDIMIGEYYMFGHRELPDPSLGATLMYEICKIQQHIGNIMPKHIFVASREGPPAIIKRPIIHKLPRSEFLNEVAKYGSNADLRSFPSDFQDMAIKVVRADMKLVETYKHDFDSPKILVDTTVYYGEQDSVVLLDDVETWHDVISNDNIVELLTFHGGHFDIIRNEVIHKDMLKKIDK